MMPMQPTESLTPLCAFSHQVIWLTLLPISLWPVCGWLTVPTTALIAFCMLGVEKIGVMIEEPFTQLPLGAIVSPDAIVDLCCPACVSLRTTSLKGGA